MKVVRQGVFETNSSSTHSLVISKDKDYVSPNKNIVVKMRNMEYLYKQNPSYNNLPEYDQLKNMTTNEVITHILNQYDYIDNEYLAENAVDNISDFLDSVGVNKGYEYDSNCWYGDKYDDEVKPALKCIIENRYPEKFNANVYAPENDFQKKLEFLYCMALARDSGSEPVSFENLYNFFRMVNNRSNNVLFYIEVPEIVFCDNNIMEKPNIKKYNNDWNNLEYRKAYDLYYEWSESWINNLCKNTIQLSEYTKTHYDRTLLEIDICGYSYPLYMELHDDCNINDLRKMFEDDQEKLADWLFDNNSGFYRYRNG
jgi:hypothetical protein